MKNTSIRKVLWLFYAVIAGILINTCDSPIALGLRVDTSEPTISINGDLGPGPGRYLRGTERIHINAQDDSGIESVVITYWHHEYGPNGELIEREKSVTASFDSDTGHYYFDVYTIEHNMADGPFRAVITATDKTGKTTVTPDLIYTVKNGPPIINMQIPRAKTRNDGKELLNHDPPGVVTDNYMMGVYEDLAGLAKGYPWIKFWKANSTEPQDFRQNAGLSGVGAADRDKGNGWVSVDEGFAEDERGEKGGSFRYYLRNRKSNGEPFGEGESHLETGLYNVKFYAVDILGNTLEWPRDAYENQPDYMTVELLATGIPPVIEIMQPETSAGTVYLRNNFTIQAQALLAAGDELNHDIAEMYFTVKGKDKKEVTLGYWEGGDIGVKRPVDFTVKLGATYYSMHQDSKAVEVSSPGQVPPNAYSYVTFNDGDFNFTITAVGDAGTRGTAPLIIYIDREPPNTQITSVSPYYSQDTPTAADTPNDYNHPKLDSQGNLISSKDSYRRWTVNSTIKIAASSSDNWGSAIDEKTGYKKFKYMVLKNNDIDENEFTSWKANNSTGTFGDYLYQRIDAMFLDEVKENPKPIPFPDANTNPMSEITESGGTYTLTFQTHKFDAAAGTTPYKIWAYVVSMDNAGNVSYQKILLNINQDTDKPRIAFGTINSDGSTFMDDKYIIRLTVADDDGLKSDSIQFRYAKDGAERDNYNSETGWKPLPAGTGLSEDGLSININDLTLLKIAGAYLGHSYNGSHEMDTSHRNVLGDEIDTKYLQVRAVDNAAVPPKVYSTDGEILYTSDWMSFKMDLTYPEVVVSTKDLSGVAISRNDENPFGAPEKGGSYKELPFAYGDIIEQNLKSITVKIDGKEEYTKIYQVSKIFEYTETPPANGFAVWKTKDIAWNGELRWRIPLEDFAALNEGSHTFEISFEDKVPQIKTMSLTFNKDITGPTVSLITPGAMVYMSETEVNNIENVDGYVPTGGLVGRYDTVVANSIKDTVGKLKGTFVDEYSSVFSAANDKYYYKIDSDSWQTVTVQPVNYGSRTVNWEITLPDDIVDGVHLLSFMVKDANGNGYGLSDQTTVDGKSEGGGNGYEKDLAFLVDRGVPVVTIQNTVASYKTDVDVDVEVTGVRGIKSLSINLNGTPKTLSIPGDVINYVATKSKQTFKIKVYNKNSTNPLRSEEGTNSVAVNVTGSSDNSGTGVWNFIYDSTPPVITLGNPFRGEPIIPTSTQWNNIKTAVLNNAIDSSSVKTLFDQISEMSVKDSLTKAVNVSFYDEYSSVVKYSYRIEGIDGFKTTWTSPVDNWIVETPIAGKNVSGSIALNEINYNSLGDDLKDGIYRLSVRVEDSLGNQNQGEVADVIFMLDRLPPKIENMKEYGGVISGTISDTFEIKSGSKIKLDTIDGSSSLVISPVPNNPQDAYNRKFNFSIPVSEFTNISPIEDGNYSVSIEVTGSSLQTAKETIPILIDTTPPAITFNTPIKDSDKQFLSYDGYSGSELGTIISAINANSSANNLNNLSVELWNKFNMIRDMSITNASTPISVTFADVHSNVGAEFWYKFDLGVWNDNSKTYTFNNGNWQKHTFATVPGKSVNYSIPLPSGISDGIHLLSIRVKDDTGHGYTITGNADDVNVPAGEGSGDGYVTKVAFMVDAKAPQAAVTTTNRIYNENFTITGDVFSIFPVKQLNVNLGGVLWGNSEVTVTNFTPVSAGKYSFSVNVPVFGTAGEANAAGYTNYPSGATQVPKYEEEYQSVSITAVGYSELSKATPWNFTFDNTGPEISFNSPLPVTDSQKVYLSNNDYNTLINAITANTSGNSLIDLAGSNSALRGKYDSISGMSIKDINTTSLTGSFSDLYSNIKEYWYKIDGFNGTNITTIVDWKQGTLGGSTGKSMTWDVPLKNTSNVNLNDGIYRLSIRVTDNLDNGYSNLIAPAGTEDNGYGFEKELVFMLDKGVTEIIPDATDLGIKNTSFNVTGKVTNTFLLTPEQLSVKLGANNITGITITPNGSRTFNFTANVNNVPAEGYQSISVNATGSSGQSDMKVLSFVYDTTGPVITTSLSGRIVQNADFITIKGGIATGHPLEDVNNAIAAASIKDAASPRINGSFTDDWSGIYSSSNTTYSYSIDDGDGVNVVSLKTENLPSTNTDDKSQSWSISLDQNSNSTLGYYDNGKLRDGYYRLNISVKDNLNNTRNVNSLAFLVDTGIPYLDIDPTPSNIKNQFTVAGQISNTFSVVQLSVRLGENTIVNYPNDSNANINSGLGTKIHNFDFNVPVDNLSGDGSYSLAVTAVGSSGQSAMKVLNFVYDTTAPVISINSPIRSSTYMTNDTQWETIKTAISSKAVISDSATKAIYDGLVNNSIRDMVSDKITGTITDNLSSLYSSGNTKFWYRIQGIIDGETPTDDSSFISVVLNPNGNIWEWISDTYGWQEINLNNDPSKSVNLEIPLPPKDGVYRLSIRVMDSLGNGYNDSDSTTTSQTEGHITNLAFIVDRNIPVLDLTSTLPEIINSNFVISGDITNTFAVEELSIRRGTEEVKINPVNNPSNFNIKTRSFTFSGVTVPSAGVTTSGPYSVTISAKGSSGQIVSITKNIIYDMTPPSITLNSPVYTVRNDLHWDAINSALTINNPSNNLNNLDSSQTATYNNISSRSVKDNATKFITGTISDEYSDISEYWYKIDNEANWTHVELESGEIGKLVSLSIPIPLDGENNPVNGLHRLSIRVKDALSNGFTDASTDLQIGSTPSGNGSGFVTSGSGYVTNLAFMVDTGIPVIDWGKETGDSGTLVSNSKDGDVNGTIIISNTYGINPGTSITMNGSNAGMSLTGPVPSGKGKFTYTVSGPAIQQGNYTLGVTVTGSSGQSKNETTNFIYDKVAPSITLVAPFSNANTNANLVYLSNSEYTTFKNAIEQNNIGSNLPDAITNSGLKAVYEKLRIGSIKDDVTLQINGNISDEFSTISSYSYRFDNTGDWEPVNLGDAGQTPIGLYVPLQIPLADLSDGIHLLSIRVKDDSGNGYASGFSTSDGTGLGYVTNLAFMLDRKTPQFNIDNLTSSITSATSDVGPFIGNVKISDTFEIRELNITLDGVTVADLNQSNITTSSFAPAGPEAYTYNATLPTPLDEGSHTLNITVTGSNGQITKMPPYTFIFDKTAPAITLTAPISNNGKVFLSDGEYSNLTSAIAANIGVNSLISLARRTNENDPKLIGDKYDDISGISIRDTGAVTAITGTFTDGFSNIGGYWYRFEGDSDWTQGTLAYPPNTIKNWTIPLPSNIQDGIYRLSIRVKDSSGNGLDNSSGAVFDGEDKGYITNLAFMVDTGAPELSVMSGAGSIYKESDTLDFTGTITNTFLVKTLSVNIDNTGSVTVPVTPVNNRSFAFTLPDILSGGTYIEGYHSVSVTATGSSDLSDMKAWSFTIDNTAPVITFNTPIRESAKQFLSSGTDSELAILESAITANTSGNSLINLKNSVGGSDNRNLWEKFEAISGMSITEIPSNGVNIAGSINDVFSNVSSYWYNIDGGEWTQRTFATPNKSVDWTIPLPDGITDGIHLLSIRVADNTGNGYTITSGADDANVPVGEGSAAGYVTNIAFMVDRGTPEIAVEKDGILIANDALLVTAKGDFNFDVTIANTFDVTSLSVSLNGTVIESSNITAVAPAGTGRTFNSTIAIPIPNGLPQGYNSISITARGSSGLSSTAVRSFVYDTTPPDIAFNSPVRDKSLTLSPEEFTTIHTAIANKTTDTGGLSGDILAKFESINSSNSIKDTSVNTLTGSFTDTYSSVFASGKNTTFEYRIDTHGGDYTAWTTSTAAVSGDMNKKSVNWTVPLEDLEDGIYRVSLRVTDELGNGPGEVENVAFIVDRGTPAVALDRFVRQDGTPVLESDGTTPLINNPILSKPFTIDGTIKGTLRIQRLNVLLNGETYASYVGVAGIDPGGMGVYVNGVKETPTGQGFVPTITLTPSADKSHYEFTVNIKGITQDGSKSVSVIAYGTSGVSGNALTIFTYDTDGPVISLNPPFMSSTLFGHIVNGEVEAINPNDNIATNSIKDSSTITISGTFNDSFSAIYKAVENTEFWYKVEGKTGYTNNIVGPTWRQGTLDISLLGAESKYLTWKITLPNNNTGTSEEKTEDGNYLLSIRIKDSLGNGYGTTSGDDAAIAGLPNPNSGPGFLTNLAFNIERGIPTLVVDQVDQFQSGNVTFNVTVSNTTLVRRLDVKQGSTYLADWGDEALTQKNITTGTNTVPREFNFTVTIPSAELSSVYPEKGGEGNYNLVITAMGSSGVTAMDARAFIYDKTPPVVTFTSPSAGTSAPSDIGTWGAGKSYRNVNSTLWVTGSPQISGTTSDTNGVADISYHLGKLNENDTNRNAIFSDEDNWTPTGLGGPASDLHTDWEGGLFYWIYQRNLNNYEDSLDMIDKDTGRRFFIPLYVRVKDQAGNINVTRYRIWVDPDMDMPTAVIINPINDNDVGGDNVRISGTAGDNQMVHSVEIRIRPVDTTGLTLVNGYYKDNTDAWAYPDTMNPADQGWIKADLQNDQQDIIVSWSYSSNKENHLTPTAVGQRRQVTIEVRAVDTKQLDVPNGERAPDLKGEPVSITVYFASGVPEIDTLKIGKTGLFDVETERDYGIGLKTSGVFTMKTTVHDDGGINSLKARVSGGGGYQEIIKNGAVVNSADLGGGTTYAITGQPISGQPTVAGRRYQLNTISGTPDWANIDLDWSASKTYVAGTWIKLKYNHASTYGITGFMTNGGNAATADDNDAGWNSQFFEYVITFTVNSLFNLPYGSTGKFTLDLQVLDNNKIPAPYSASGSYSLDIDNFYPGAVIQTQYNAVTENFYIKGSAEDYRTNPSSGTVQGLARVLVYFSRMVNGSRVYYNAAGVVSNGMTTRPNVKNMAVTPAYTGDSPNAASFANFPVLTKNGNTWTSTHAMVIDRQELSGDGDGDGTLDEMWEDKGATKNWQARFNTSAFTTARSDGPLMVHYVIMDEVGNATHYQEEIYVGNNAPLIREITLGTNLNGNGTTMVNASPIPIGKTPEGNREITTNFRVRNNSFGLQLNALYGNVRKHYRVYYVTRGDEAINSTLMTRGNVYTIATPGNTNWVNYGALNNNAGTTFVASGRANPTSDSGESNSGTVYTYTGVTGTELSGQFGSTNNNGTNDDIANMTFGSANFGAALIPDSGAPPADPPYDLANPPLQRDRRFIIKVYDETVAGGVETMQLAHVALINLDISNTDTVAPVIEFAPFGQEYVLRTSTGDNDNPIWANNADRVPGAVSEYTRNVVTTGNNGTGAKKGYVQYENDDTAATNKRAHLSGMVIFKGKAADNNRIQRITAQIPGYTPTGGASGAEFDIATWNGTALAPATNTTTIDIMRSDTTASARGFESERDSLTLDYNHVVNWSFAWDTSTVANTAENNVTITFKVYDTNSGSPATARSAQIQTTVNIVPYITEVVTSLPSNFERSAASGWYPVQENELIELRGFNLTNHMDLDGNGNGQSNQNATAKPRVSVNGAEINGGSGQTVWVYDTKTRLGVYVDSDSNHTNATNTVVSGELVVTVNSVASFNNRNNNNAVYNQEPNGITNNTLTDNRGLYVWNTGLLINESSISSPIMRMDSTANRYTTFGAFIHNGTAGSTGNSNVKLIRNNTGLSSTGAPQRAGTGNTPSVAEQTDTGTVIYFNNRFLNNALGVTTNGDWAVASTNMTSTGATFSFIYNNLGKGGFSSTGTITHATNTNGARRLMLMLGDDYNRVKFPRIVTQRTGGTQGGNPIVRTVLAYYDSKNSAVALNYGYFAGDTYIGDTYNSATPAGDATRNVQFNGVNYVADQNGTTPAAAYRVADSTANSTKARGGQYVAAGLLNNGRAVVAWYDATQGLYFSYGNSAPGLNSTTVPAQTMADWQTNAVKIKDYAGTHVDMAVDEANGVHLAYVDARNGGLWYTYIPNATSPASHTTVRVDTYLSTGQKLMINVRREGTRDVPYITYIHNAFAETKNSIRVAWQKNSTLSNGTKDDHTFTGNWEVMTVPAETIPLTDEYVSNGVPTGTTWTVPNNSTLGSTDGTGNLSRTILLGYMTEKWYEGAVLKHSIWQ